MLLTLQAADHRSLPAHSGHEWSAALQEAFYAALLLTGCRVSAEDAVLQAIESLAPEDVNTDIVFHRAIAAAIRLVDDDAAQETRANRGRDLPAELGRVLEMEFSLRSCFVLRTLLGLSVSACARALRLDRDRVIVNTQWALQWLARDQGNRGEAAARS